MSRAVKVAFWLTPIVFCIYIYWMGMRIWFQQDDFAWLNLRTQVHDFRSFLWAMFTPLAQGTIRPWSERGFFMVFSYFFGLRALPYRLFVFLNQFVNIVLLMMVARKLTRSQVAAFIAPLLWVSCNALVTPMTWSAAYNEIQCTTFLLLSFYLFIRYTEAGDRRFYWAQWVTFVLGFGALEINVVYPAIAGAYALFFARRYFRSTLPMFAVSVVYAVVHQLAGPGNRGFYYDMNYHPGSIANILIAYWKILFGFHGYAKLGHGPYWAANAAVLLLTAVIAGFTGWQARKRRFLPLFLLLWFLIVLSPLLPLHNHITEYYVMIPGIGMAILGAHAISLAFERGWAAAGLACGLAALYMVPSVILDKAGAGAYFDRADRCRAVVQSVAYAKRLHPNKTFLLQNIDDDVFWSCVYDSPFRVLGWNDVFLTPESRQNIHEDVNLGPVDPYILPEAATARALETGTAVVYATEGRKLHNVTQSYTAFVTSQPAPPLASSIDVGQPYFNDQLGEGWYNAENGYRWCKQRAVVYLRGPTAPGQQLIIHGFAPEQQVKERPLHLALTIDGRPSPAKVIEKSSPEFHFEYSLPADLTGRPKIEIAVRVERILRVPSDDRELGVVFGDFSIR